MYSRTALLVALVIVEVIGNHVNSSLLLNSTAALGVTKSGEFTFNVSGVVGNVTSSRVINNTVVGSLNITSVADNGTAAPLGFTGSSWNGAGGALLNFTSALNNTAGDIVVGTASSNSTAGFNRTNLLSNFTAAPSNFTPWNFMGTPWNLTAASSNFTAPWNFTAPPNNFTAPWNFTAPPSNFTAPWNFTAPPSNFTAPWNFTAPPSNFTAPWNFTSNFTAALWNFTAPPNNFTAPWNFTSNFTASPSNFTATPWNFTASPSNFTAAPSNFTASPSNFTATPWNFTASPSNFTAAPSNFTASPSNFTATPWNFTASPSTEAPVSATAAPINVTGSPIPMTSVPTSNPTASPFKGTAVPSDSFTSSPTSVPLDVTRSPSSIPSAAPSGVTDSCDKCSSIQRCVVLVDGQVTCHNLDECSIKRRLSNLIDCTSPDICKMLPIGLPSCTRPLDDNDCNKRCISKGLVCNSDMKCVVDKCIDFVWPPEGIEFCDALGKCSSGKKCTGCTSSVTCDSTGSFVQSNDCRPTCESISFECVPNQMKHRTSEEISTCCTSSGIGCVSFDCYNSETTENWSSDQLSYCCNSTGRGCLSSDVFNCFDSDPRSWSFLKSSWCCKYKSIACPSVGTHCNTTRNELTKDQSDYCCKTSGKGCTTDNGYDCTWDSTTTSPWDSKHRRWCCARKGIRCPASDPFECHINTSTYSDNQRAWCCSNKNIGCEYQCQLTTKEINKLPDSHKSYCCLHFDVGCKSNKEQINCYDSSHEWDTKQKEYCCLTNNIGCSTNCNVAKGLLSQSQLKECCDTKGIHCQSSKTTFKTDGVEQRILFKSSWDQLSKNPLRFVQLCRSAMILSSKVLQRNPSLLTVTYAGMLKSHFEIPTKDMTDNWGYLAQSNWNVDTPSLITFLQSGVLQSSHTVNRLSRIGKFKNHDDEYVMVSYYVEGSNSEIASITADLENGKETIFLSNNEGYTMILADAKIEVIVSDPPKTPKKSSKFRLWFIAMPLLSIFTIGSLIGAYIVRRRQKQERPKRNDKHKELQDATDMELEFEMEDDDDDDDTLRSVEVIMIGNI